jgi:hypothetical protein
MELKTKRILLILLIATLTAVSLELITSWFTGQPIDPAITRKIATAVLVVIGVLIVFWRR